MASLRSRLSSIFLPLPSRAISPIPCPHFVGGRPSAFTRKQSPLNITPQINSFHRISFRLQGPGQATTDHHTDFIVRCPYPDVPIPDNVSVSQLVLNELPKYKNAIALVDGVTGQEMTFGELHTSVVKATSALVKLGLRKGDVVTIFSPNCIQYAIATIAIAAAGATFSGVNPLYTAYELKHTLELVQSRFLMTIPALLPVVRDASNLCQDIKEVIVFGDADGCRPFSSLLEDDMTAFPENIDIRPKEDIAALLFSSGTTGLPKAVMLSHYNVMASVIHCSQRDTLDYNGSQCLLAVLPFFHIYGQAVILFPALFCGAKMVILPGFQPTSYLEAIQKHRPTYLNLVPPLLIFLAKSPLVTNYDVSSVERALVGAAPLSVTVVQEFLDRLKQGFILRQGYGLTETAIASLNGPEGNKYETCGPPIRNTMFKIVDMETNETVGPGKQGELYLRGPQVTLGYYKDKKATDEALVDGWLRTGDVGHCDEDGHIVVDDRLKEMIKVKGYQVVPAELEAVLVGHPSVQDAAVIGVKDEKLGEAPKAFVVLKPEAKTGEEELKQYVSGKVAPFKRLVGGIEFRSEIPKSPSGKILRRILK